MRLSDYHDVASSLFPDVPLWMPLVALIQNKALKLLASKRPWVSQPEVGGGKIGRPKITLGNF
jgi:hypothetical protein